MMELSPVSSARPRSRLATRFLMAFILISCMVGLNFWWSWTPDTTIGKSADTIATEFDAALESRNFKEAETLTRAFEKVTSAKDDRLILFRARLDLAEGRETDALKLLAGVPDDSSAATMAHQIAAKVHLRAGRLIPAERHNLAAIRMDPKLVTPRRELVYLYGIQLRRRELRDVFEGLAEVAPMSFQNLFHWCLMRGNDWDPEEIIADMTKFLAADPTDRWSRIALARSLKRLAKLDEAENALAPLPEEDPDALALRSQIALDRGDLEKAATLLQKGPSDHFDLAVLRALMALANGDLEEATAQFEIALRIDPGNRDAIVGMARVLSSRDRVAEARSWRDRAEKLDKLASLIQEAAKPSAPTDRNLPKKLAESCESVGYIAEAKAWWGLVATRDPLDQEAQAALYRLGRAFPKAP